MIPEAAVEAAYLPCPHMCLRGSDIGVYSAGDPVAYAHPRCPVHGFAGAVKQCDCGHGQDVHFQDGCVDKRAGSYYCPCAEFEAAK